MAAEVWKDVTALGVQEQRVPRGMASCVSNRFMFCVRIPRLKDCGREVSQLIPAVH